MEKQQLIREAKNLSLHLRESREYQAYTAARETAFANDTTKALIEQYHRLQLKAQGDMLSCGKAEDKTMEELKKLGELLQFNPAAAGFRLKGEVASYSARGWFGQVSFPSTDEFYYTLTGEQESDLQVYWQDNTLRIVSESPGEVTLHLKDLRDTYQFPAGGCVITDFADGKIIVQ